VNWSTTVRRTAIVVLLTLASIVVHELGHFVVYKIAGIPVKISLQSVRPVGPVSPQVDRMAKAGGPTFSVVAAILCLVLVCYGSAFVWVTAAFTNAPIRLFPSVMDLVHAVKGVRPFSDEGDLALSWTTDPTGRTLLVMAPLVLYVALTVAAGQRFRFAKQRLTALIGIYLLSLGVDIGVVLIDEALHPMAM